MLEQGDRMRVWRQVLAGTVTAALALVLLPVSATAAGSALDHSGPTDVTGGEVFSVVFTASQDGAPLAGVTIEVERHRYADHDYRYVLEETTELVTDQQGQVRVEMSAGAVDYYVFSAFAVLPDVEHRVDVQREPTTLTPAPVPDRALPGESVAVSATLALADGTPLPREQVQVQVTTSSQGVHTYDATTDRDGQVTVVLDHDDTGTSTIRFSWAGTAVLDDVVAWGTLYRGPAPTTLTATGPADGEGGVPVVVSGTLTPAYGQESIRVTYEPGGAQYVDAVTDVDGTWSAEVVPQPGYNWWTVSFAGDERLQGASTTYSLEAPQRATSFEDVVVEGARAGDDHRLTGRLTGATGVATVTVAWDGGEASAFTTASDGTFDLFRPTPGTVGTHTMRLAYAGDGRSLPGSAEYQVEVRKGDPGFYVFTEAGADPGKQFLARGGLDYYTTLRTHVTVTAPDGGRSRIPVQAVESDEFPIPLVAPDTPGESATWKIRFPGDADHEAATAWLTVRVREPHQIRFREPSGPATVGGDLDLTVKFGTLRPEIDVVATRPDGSVAWERDGVSYDSILRVIEPVDSAVRVEVTAAPDSWRSRTRATYVLRPFRVVTTRLGGDHEMKDGVAVYRWSSLVRIGSRVRPASGCVTQQVQVRTPSGWRTEASRCRDLGSRGTVTTPFRVDRDAGHRYRVRSLVGSTSWYRPSESGWRYFRFRR
jgi:hypothetical protein